MWFIATAHTHHMSLINWLQAKKTGLLRSGELPRKRKSFGQTTLPLVSPRRGRRILRREQLFSVVRESMIRGGVLSTSYDFKVLTLDASGDSFLVLIDLALPADVMPDPYLLEIERWVQDSAQSRHSMSIPSVYWRRKAAHDQRGMALKAAVDAQIQRQASSASPTAIPMPPISHRNVQAQAVDAAEVEAFRQALTAVAPPQHRRPGDTKNLMVPVPESHSDFSALSETQYGKL
jgi:hypothetical protein